MIAFPFEESFNKSTEAEEPLCGDWGSSSTYLWRLKSLYGDVTGGGGNCKTMSHCLTLDAFRSDGTL